MKKIYAFICSFILTAILWAQAPQKMSYQAVIRNSQDALVTNQKVGIQMSILQGSEVGNVVFSELHFPTTNANGLATLTIGTGAKLLGTLDKIDWSKGPYYIKTETDVTGATNFDIVAISEFMSVPYALYAANSQPGPKGDKGDTGAIGPQGPAGLPGKDGLNGKDGVDGKDGAIGPKGDKGDTGAIGPQGPAGLPGKDGLNGKDGVDGKDGAIGPKGDKGDTGAIGPQGPAGLPGKDGLNGKDGVDGKDGAIGPKGDKGDTGAIGPQGPAGLPGKDGLNGKDGVDGKDGAIGPKGDKGDTGAIGPQGPAGLPGKDGLNGKDGVDGKVGLSAYDLWLSKGNQGSLEDFLSSLKGQKGDNGDGTSNVKGTAAGDMQYWNGSEWVIVSKGGQGEALIFCDGKPTWTTTGMCPGKVQSIDCQSFATIKEEFKEGVYINLSHYINYQGGNGGLVKHQVVSSTGDVNGLSLEIHENKLDAGSGNLYCTILGTPYKSGKAEFLIKIGEASCTAQIQVSPKATLSSLDCNSSKISGSLAQFSKADGISITLNYTGGNGGYYNDEKVMIAEGLNAYRPDGKLNVGDGVIKYDLYGSPITGGTFSIPITLGNKTCNVVVDIAGEKITGTSGSGVTDASGYTYKTVKIGAQEWMAENLNVDKFNDGTSIVESTSKQSNNVPFWSNYQNDQNNGNKYGKLYNHYVIFNALNGGKNVCPTGWHVPTEIDWENLINSLGGYEVAGGKLKEGGTTNWASPNTNASNSSLFNGLPAGFGHASSNSQFYGLSNSTSWWASTYNSNSTTLSIPRYSLSSSSAQVNKSYTLSYTNSIRCIKDTPAQVENIDCKSVIKPERLFVGFPSNGKEIAIPYSGGNSGMYNEKRFNSNQDTSIYALLQMNSVKSGNGEIKLQLYGKPTTTGIITFDIQILNQSCTIEMNVEELKTPLSGNGNDVKDINGNTYKTVYIGSQQWMAENLNAKSFNDGTLIEQVIDSSQWNTLKPMWTYYGNDSINNARFGKLYSGDVVYTAVNGNKNVCPVGWHVPSEADWLVLYSYINKNATTGGILKETGTTNWMSPNTGATDSLNFKALPAGYVTLPGRYMSKGMYSMFWASSTDKSRSDLPIRYMFYNNALFYSTNVTRTYGFSIRCVKD